VQVLFHQWNVVEPARQRVAAPDRDQVRVWTATIPKHDTDRKEFKNILSPAEWERAEKFTVSGPRRQFVLGRVVLRQILGACLQVAPATLVFGYQPAGKPFLLPSTVKPDLRFNLSHSNEMVALAVACGREVGVDVEWIHGLDDWADLGSRIFSPPELAELYALPPAQHRQAFFNGWTRKEAWLKATGQGLIDDLPAIEVTLAPGAEAKWKNLPDGLESVRQWTLQTLPLPSEYAGAVVIQNWSAIESWNPAPAR
jgi:4'-phosphopantetheinyl transferase